MCVGRMSLSVCLMIYGPSLLLIKLNRAFMIGISSSFTPPSPVVTSPHGNYIFCRWSSESLSRSLRLAISSKSFLLANKAMLAGSIAYSLRSILNHLLQFVMLDGIEGRGCCLWSSAEYAAIKPSFFSSISASDSLWAFSSASDIG